MKTVRFVTVVEKSGRPHVHLTWTAPTTDLVLQRALKRHRLLTVHQHLRGSKKDYATVGLQLTGETQFLVFPNSLKSFSDKKVVGIQYELLAEAEGKTSKRAESKIPSWGTSAMGKRSKIIPFSKPPVEAVASSNAVVELKTPTPAPLLPPPEPVDEDPVRRAIRDALADLTAGHMAKAERGLRALL